MNDKFVPETDDIFIKYAEYVKNDDEEDDQLVEQRNKGEERDDLSTWVDENICYKEDSILHQSILNQRYFQGMKPSRTQKVKLRAEFEKVLQKKFSGDQDFQYKLRSYTGGKGWKHLELRSL